MGKKIFAHLKIFAVGNLDLPQPVSVIIWYLALYKGGKKKISLQNMSSLYFSLENFMYIVLCQWSAICHIVNGAGYY